MKAYVYQAALICEDCGTKVCAELTREGRAPKYPEDEYTYDTDDYPKGPYSDGGGEADCPQHCDACDVFLENNLTDYGMQYVTEAVAESKPDGIARVQWAPFYDIPLE